MSMSYDLCKSRAQLYTALIFDNKQFVVCSQLTTWILQEDFYLKYSITRVNKYIITVM